MGTSKRVLIIASHYYPSNNPPSQRVGKFAKYLPKFGWEPVVLCAESTPQNDPKYDSTLLDRDVCRTIRVPYDISSGRYLFGCIVVRILKETSLLALRFPLPLRLYRDMLSRADSLLRKENFDVILATVPLPFPLAIANKMSSKYHTPWVADFRDLPAEHIENLGRFSPHHLDIRLHKSYCKSASALITVSKPLVERLKSWQSKPVSLVYNGFDPDDYQKNVEVRTDHFTIVYCGNIYINANPAPLVDALDLILKKDSKILERFRLLVYGAQKHRIRRLFENRPCSGLIQCEGRVPFRESIRAQQEAAVLLFLPYFPFSAVKGLMTSKIFEYLGAGRPILSIYGDNDVTDALLEETQGGVVARTPEQIVKMLENWIDEWRRTGSVEYKGRTDKIQAYTREKQTGKLAEVLEQVYESWHRS